MSVNSSSPSNSLLDLVNSDCSPYIAATITAFNIAKVCIHVPLSIFILYMAYQQWRIQLSFQVMSHSDIFTYHLSVMELLWCLGIALYCWGFLFKLPHVIKVAGYFLGIIFCGETGFHLLTCVDRYLAVVHPLIYRALRNTRGIKIRNICIGCVWLLFFMWSSVTNLNDTMLIISHFCLLGLSLPIVSYCSLRVLCALTYPGPREEGRDREVADKAKQSAFFTIMAILAALCFWFLGDLVTSALIQSLQLSERIQCTLWVFALWFSLPSTLVLPLLYLRKTGKLSCWQSNHGQK